MRRKLTIKTAYYLNRALNLPNLWISANKKSNVSFEMAVRLTIVEDGDTSSKYVRTFVQDRIVLGRSRSCDICLPDMAVSTRHAEIHLKGTDYVLMDLDSLNGSFVNDKPVLSFQQRKLHNDDVIRAAGFSILVQLGVAPGPDEPRDASVRQARQMLARLSMRTQAPPDTLTFTVTGGPCRGARFTFSPQMSRAIIGRGGDASFVLEDRDISRAHAEIAVIDQKVTVRDLGSKNGLVIDGARVDAAVLAFGDSFAVGKSTLTLEHPAEAALGAIFEAPEEETSSFALATTPSALSSDEAQHASQTQIFASTQPQSTQEASQQAVDRSTDDIKIGPEDPLTAEASPLSPDEEEVLFETLAQNKTGSDTGLIIIGIILLLAATAGLAYLFH
jgi:pSer/pThr/pTyr-binding forkhead associated (FHA) protein